MLCDFVSIMIFRLLFVASTASAYVDWEDMSGQIQFEVASHSFAAPFRYHASFPNWYLSGSTVYTRDSRSGLIMNPSVLNRQGILWNREKLPTSEFEASIMLHLDQGMQDSSKPAVPPPDQSFGVWFAPTNMSQAAQVVASKAVSGNPDWANAFFISGLEKSTGVANRFGGVGFFMNPTDSSGKRIPQITLVNAGERKTVPLAEKEMSATQLMYMRLRLKVGKDSVSVWSQDRVEWRQVVELPRSSGPDSGFVGITSFSGSARDTLPYKVRVSSLRVKSHDLMSLQGLREVTSLFEKEGLTLKELAEGPSDALSQTRMIRKLTKIVSEYIGSTAPDFQRFRDQVGALQHNVTELEGAIAKLGAETKLTFKGSGKLSELASQVQSIHSLLVQVESERETLLQSVEAAKQNDTSDHIDRHLGFYKRQFGYRVGELSWEIKDKGRFSFIMFLIVVAFAIVVGVAFYIRLNRYAQKAHLF